MAAFESGLSDTSGTCLLPTSRLSPPRRLSKPCSGRRSLSPSTRHAPASKAGQRPRWRYSIPVGPPAGAPAAAGPAATAAGWSEDRLPRSFPVCRCSWPPASPADRAFCPAPTRPCAAGAVIATAPVTPRIGSRLASGRPGRAGRGLGSPVARCARRRRQPGQVVAIGPDRQSRLLSGSGARRPQRAVSICAAAVRLRSPLCSIARTQPWRRHSRMVWMRRCAAASEKRNSRTA